MLNFPRVFVAAAVAVLLSPTTDQACQRACFLARHIGQPKPVSHSKAGFKPAGRRRENLQFFAKLLKNVEKLVKEHGLADMARKLLQVLQYFKNSGASA